MQATSKRLMIVAMAALLAATGCSKNSPVANPEENEFTEEEVVLKSEFGEYTTSDEAPGFGDPAVVTSEPAESNAADPVAAEAAIVAAMDERSGIPTRFVRVTWGMLEGDSTVSQVTDFSGYAEINRGTLAVMKTVRFERPGDHLVLPRTSRQNIEFVSKTTVHFDGLVLALIDNDSAATDVAGELTIMAGSYARTFTFEELDSLDLIEDVGSDGNQVSIQSRLAHVDAVPGGFFAGHWYRRTNHSGVFEGRWINIYGTSTGFLRGKWGYNDRGARAFAGKIISHEGRFIGLMGGTWGYSDRSDARGWLRGRWVGKGRVEFGKLAGHWHAGRPGDGRGFLHGRWNEANVDRAGETN